MMLKKLCPILLSVFIAISAAFSISAAGEPASVSAPDGYEQIAANSNFILFANMKTGDFAVFDVKADQIRYSGQWEVLDSSNPISELNFGHIKTDLVSMVSVSYVQVSTISSTAVPTSQNSYAYSVIKDNVKTKLIDKGYRAEYYFEDIDSTIPVEIALTEDGITAGIPGDKIKTNKDYRITKIDLLPGFMAADSRYSGYVFVPSGSGALIPLNSGKGDLAAYEEMVYGDDTAVGKEEYTGETEPIRVPVYGIKMDDSAVTAIIEEGDSTAAITAQANSSTTSFTRIYSQYILSIVDSTTLFESNYANQRIIYGAEDRKTIGDYKVKFVFSSGEQASYSGMAEVYREYLDLKKNAQKPTMALTLYGAAKKKASFLGIPYTKTIPLTSFDQAREILKDLNDSGISVTLKYIGIGNNGIENNKIPVNVKPMSKLGGKKAYKRLIDYVSENENAIFTDVNFVDIKKSGNGFSALSDVCRSIFNTRTPIYKYMRSVYVPVNNENPSYLLKPAKVKKAVRKFLSSYHYDTGISLDKLGEELYSDFSEKGTARIKTEGVFKEILNGIADKDPISVNAGNAYTYGLTDRIFDIPMTNDGNLLFSASVPFLQMVLHGSVPYSAPAGSTLLDCIEYGADPGFSGIYVDDSNLLETTFNWLYASTYRSWSDTSKAVFKEYYNIYKTLYNKRIVFHENKDGISVTVFENGTKIYVNRSGAEVTFNGVTVPEMGFTAAGGDEQ